MQPSRTELRRQIGMLRFQKAKSILTAQSRGQPIEGFFQSSVYDMLMLPLYYAWEKLDYGTVYDLRMEEYMQESYSSFRKNALTSISEMITFVSSNNIFMTSRGCDLILQKSLINTYNKIIESINNNYNYGNRK